MSRRESFSINNFLSKTFLAIGDIKFVNQWRNKGGGERGIGPRRRLKNSHTKGRQNFFFKGAPFYTGAIKS